MKKFATYIFLILPFLSFGQLFPKVGEFRGNIEKVVEIRYGKEGKSLNFLEKIFLPAVLSGWQYIYQFDHNANLVKRTSIFEGTIKEEYTFHRDTTKNVIIEREINTTLNNKQESDYLEYESILDPSGKIIKVTCSAYNSKTKKKELIQIDKDAEYVNNQLMSFLRQSIDSNGNISGEEKISLFYTYSGNLNRLERKDLNSGLSTIINFSYDNARLVIDFSVNFLSELHEYGKKEQNQVILYKYDRNGNWIRKYWKADDKYLLEAKRRIKYW